MPLVEIDDARLDRIAAEIDRMAAKLPCFSIDQEAARDLLRNDAEMVAFIIDRYFRITEGQG